MKKILALLYILWAPAALAQSTSIVTDIYDNNNLSLSKVDNVKSNTDKSLDAIENTATDWNNELTRGNNELDESSSQIQEVIDYMVYKEDVFFETETDPKGSTYQTYATQNVPSCYGDTSRLVYQNGWKCLEPIDCGTIDANQTDWYQTEDGYCVRKQGIWRTGSWSSSSYGQGCGSRSVTCRDENTNASLNTTHCSQPAPASSRTCVSNPDSFYDPDNNNPDTPPPPPVEPPTCTTTGSWTQGGWGECSNGVKTRSVTCSYCNCTGSKPATTSTEGCETSYTGAWQNVEGECTNGSKTNTVTCVGGECDPTTKPETTTESCSMVANWDVGEWGNCEGGYQTRSVSCPVGYECNAGKPEEIKTCCEPAFNWGTETGGLVEYLATRRPFASPKNPPELARHLESSNGNLYTHFGLNPKIDIKNSNAAFYRANYTFTLDKSLIKNAWIDYVDFDDIAWIRVNGHTMFFGPGAGDWKTGGQRFDHFNIKEYDCGNDNNDRTCTTLYSVSNIGGEHLARGREGNVRSNYSINIMNQLKDGLNDVEVDLVVAGIGELYFSFGFTPADNKNICSVAASDRAWQVGEWTLTSFNQSGSNNYVKRCDRSVTCEATACTGDKPKNAKVGITSDSSDRSCNFTPIAEFYL